MFNASSTLNPQPQLSTIPYLCRRMRRKGHQITPAKVLSVLLLSACLLFLTGVNFFIYPPKGNAVSSVAWQGKESNEDRPSSPVEEKAPSGCNTSIQEEYLHEKNHLHELTLLEEL